MEKITIFISQESYSNNELNIFGFTLADNLGGEGMPANYGFGVNKIT